MRSTRFAAPSTNTPASDRLEAILEIASQWNKTSEMEPLLKQMAEAATRLAGRRSGQHLSVGSAQPHARRPAGPGRRVGGELRIPDNSGVVGQVVHTGQPRRASTHSADSEINRQVDRQLGYQTRTLVCVPLRGSKGELFGAFEVINKLAGDFTADDETGPDRTGQPRGRRAWKTRSS